MTVSSRSSELRREQIEVGVLCARRSGGIFTAATAIYLILVHPVDLADTAPIVVALALSTLILLVRRGPLRAGPPVVAVSAVLTLAALAGYLLPGVDGTTIPIVGSITMLASMAIPSALFALGFSRRLLVTAVVAFVPVLWLSVAATARSGRAIWVALTVVLAWTVYSVGARWIASSVERAHIGTAALRTAHEAERRSSESEARRRYDARLLHDTILATLTLVAHRGEGVPAGTLMTQAASDLTLLRRLNTSETVPSMPSGPIRTTALPRRFEEVDRRFRALGLSLSWHTPPTLDVPERVLAALAQATGECVENVRRHSGVTAADITITQDGDDVRVAVSDAGRGFDPAAVPAGRLGLEQSVTGRIEAVGGTVRIFSAPRSGTTVLMAVHR